MQLPSTVAYIVQNENANNMNWRWGDIMILFVVLMTCNTKSTANLLHKYQRVVYNDDMLATSSPRYIHLHYIEKYINDEVY